MTYDPAYTKRWRVERDRGVTRTLPAGPVRAHLEQLVNDGLTLSGIAEIAGVSVSTAHNLANGGQPRCKRLTATKLLAVTTGQILGRSNVRGLVPRVGATRRIQALLAIGWRHSDISAAMRAAGAATRSHVVIHQVGRLLERRTFDAVAAAYEQLSMRPGPNQRTPNWVRASGYLPPLAWDDIDTDPEPPTVDPFTPIEVLDEVAVERIMSGTLTVAKGVQSPERVEAVRRLASFGLTDSQIAERTRWKPANVLATRIRHGIPAGQPCTRVAS